MCASLEVILRHPEDPVWMGLLALFAEEAGRPAVLPEPAPVVLFGSSLLGVAVWGRKRLTR